MISQVLRFQTDVVLVFDENGEQMPEYQGLYEKVRAKILTRSPRTTKFFHEPFVLVLRKDW